MPRMLLGQILRRRVLPPRALLAAIPLALMASGGGAAARDYAFCLKGCDFGSGDCSFDSYQQCQAAAAGREAWCDANPSFLHQSREPQAIRYSRRRP